MAPVEFRPALENQHLVCRHRVDRLGRRPGSSGSWSCFITLHHRIWLALNMALSLAVSLFVVGVVYDLWGLEFSLTTLPILLIAGMGFYLSTLIYPGIFFLFIVYEVVALVFALGAYIFLAIHKDLPGAGLMATAILVSIIAAGIQANKSVILTFIWRFDHNGIYHLVQVLGLMLLLMGLRRSVLY